MDGMGIVKGLTVTLKRFADTYLEDLRWLLRGEKRYYSEDGIAGRMSSDARGLFTIQYPDEKMPVPEEFRYVPFLIYEEAQEGEEQEDGEGGGSGGRKIRCTSCGICAKVCPPQCIWIERTTHPKTGRPVPEPVDFFIDVDICMNCGFCAEYCPFDAIKMDHDYELSVYNRFEKNIYDMEKLLKPLSYYAEIRPVNYEREERARAEALAAKAARKAKPKTNTEAQAEE